MVFGGENNIGNRYLYTVLCARWFTVGENGLYFVFLLLEWGHGISIGKAEKAGLGLVSACGCGASDLSSVGSFRCDASGYTD